MEIRLYWPHLKQRYPASCWLACLAMTYNYYMGTSCSENDIARMIGINSPNITYGSFTEKGLQLFLNVSNLKKSIENGEDLPDNVSDIIQNKNLRNFTQNELQNLSEEDLQKITIAENVLPLDSFAIPTLDEIYAEISAGRPLGCLVGANRPDLTMSKAKNARNPQRQNPIKNYLKGHFIMITGCERETNYLVVSDPEYDQVRTVPYHPSIYFAHEGAFFMDQFWISTTYIDAEYVKLPVLKKVISSSSRIGM